MSCECNRTKLQGKQYCQDCMPDECHWLVPVSKEPDPFLMDRNHAYIMPNNTIYVLSHDRTQAIDISGNDIDLTPYALKTELANKITELNQKLTTGLEGAKYYEGEGIRIDADKRIHSTVNLTEVNERLDAIEQAGNNPYKAGTGIEITPDLTINNTVTTDAIESRVQALEEKEDQNTTYTAGTGLQLNGTEFSVDPNDLPGLELYAKKAQEAWITPTLVNGWYDIRATEPPQYMKDEFGFVHFRGVVAKTAQSQSNVPFSLPTAYRPTVNTTFSLSSIGPSSSRSLAVTIFSSTGNVDFAGAIAGTETWYALSSINFKGV